MTGDLNKPSGGNLSGLANGEQPIGASTMSPSDSKTVEECLAELDALVGLTEVKQQVRKLLALQQANEVRKADALPVVPLPLHLVFTGDAGTGKTTVARIISQLYRSANLLPQGTLVETDRSGLVAGYVGQTALKVNDMLNKADGGVLYIDEAYSLYQAGGQDFGDEAIAALVKGMEDRRNSLAVIVSGYEEEMNNFIDSNPGLRSRFPTYIRFPNYTAEELLEIFTRMAAAHSIQIAGEVAEVLARHFGGIDAGGHRGNARYVRNVFEAMYANMALAAAEDGNIEAGELKQFTQAHLPRLDDDTPKAFGFTSA